MHPRDVIRLADDQMQELKQLLQPGFELSTLMLADYKAQRAEAKPEPAGEAQKT